MLGYSKHLGLHDNLELDFGTGGNWTLNDTACTVFRVVIPRQLVHHEEEFRRYAGVQAGWHAWDWRLLGGQEDDEPEPCEGLLDVVRPRPPRNAIKLKSCPPCS